MKKQVLSKEQVLNLFKETRDMELDFTIDYSTLRESEAVEQENLQVVDPNNYPSAPCSWSNDPQYSYQKSPDYENRDMSSLAHLDDNSRDDNLNDLEKEVK